MDSELSKARHQHRLFRAMLYSFVDKWDAGDLVVTTEQLRLFGFPSKDIQKNLASIDWISIVHNVLCKVPMGTVCLALDSPPRVGYAYIRGLHDGKLCAINSNFLRKVPDSYIENVVSLQSGRSA